MSLPIAFPYSLSNIPCLFLLFFFPTTVDTDEEEREKGNGGKKEGQDQTLGLADRRRRKQTLTKLASRLDFAQRTFAPKRSFFALFSSPPGPGAWRRRRKGGEGGGGGGAPKNKKHLLSSSMK